MSAPVELLVGLGNPGAKYDDTRHNAGFWFVDRVASRLGVSLRANSRFRGAVGEGEIDGRRLRLLEPDTFMNRSGDAVAALATFYRIPPSAILIAHDEIDLPPGTVRLKRGGGHGGHNGLRDILPKLGDPGFARLRIGVGHPGRADQVIGYVLRRPSADDRRAIDDAVERALEQFPLMAAGSFERAMNILHTKPAAEKDEKAEQAG